ncbi:MAG TPA: LysR family transcriptional regulator [Rhodanobacteraceae bacterium]|nr:LysR family transcriptional regulator [Rhodanobacteraceae bacterium]
MQRSMISTSLAAVSLRDLALVQAVHRLGGFTAAARAMHISPSGLSHQIQKVEQALEAVLFERGGRSILPTAAGQRLLAQIDQVLAAAEDLQHAAHNSASAFGGELRLGVLSTLGPYLLPHLIEPFPQTFPGTRLSLSEGKPRGLLRRLHEGELDAVLAQPAQTPPGVTMQPLFFEPYDVLMHHSHPLAGRDHVRIEELDDDAILMAESHGNDPDQDDDERIQDVSLESLAALVALRGGYTLVPSLARQRLASIADVQLARIEEIDAPPGRHIALYWRQASPWAQDLETFRELLRELLASVPGLQLDAGEIPG